LTTDYTYLKVFIAGVITVVDGNDGRATDVVVTAVAAVGPLYARR
jgi:hypothetical protein